MAKPKPADDRKVIARNKKALHKYAVMDTFEAGIALKGSEVKSLREGKVSLAESYARIDDSELVLLGAHIDAYRAGGYANHDPIRRRTLLMHRREIKRLNTALAQKGLTLVPLSMYFKRGRAKVELALVRGKKLYDKREALRERDADRAMRRAMSPRHRSED